MQKPLRVVIDENAGEQVFFEPFFDKNTYQISAIQFDPNTFEPSLYEGFYMQDGLRREVGCPPLRVKWMGNAV